MSPALPLLFVTFVTFGALGTSLPDTNPILVTKPAPFACDPTSPQKNESLCQDLCKLNIHAIQDYCQVHRDAVVTTENPKESTLKSAETTVHRDSYVVVTETPKESTLRLAETTVVVTTEPGSLQTTVNITEPTKAKTPLHQLMSEKPKSSKSSAASTTSIWSAFVIVVFLNIVVNL